MEIINMPIGEIIPYSKNPRINNGAVDKTIMSIKEYGWQQPIVIDKNKIVIAGHTRLKAAIKMGLESCPVLIAENLTPAQSKAYRIADNRTGELATWDDELLAVEAKDLIAMNFDIELTGFDLSYFNIEEKSGDEIPPGDNYQEQYGVIIMCESETEQETIFNEMTEQGYTCRVVTT